MLNDKCIALEKVLKAKTDWEVLELHNGAKLTGVTLKSQYRKLAILVHPDKNDDTEAPQGFVKLQQAYESLLKLTDQKHDPPEPSNGFDSKSEAQAHHRQDEYETKSDNKFKRKRRYTPDLSTEAKFNAFNEIFGDDDLETHSDSWKKFCDRNAGANNNNSADPIDTIPLTGSTERPASSDTHSIGAESSRSVADPPHCCLLCRRQFTSLETLTRHVNNSALHQANLKSKIM